MNRAGMHLSKQKGLNLTYKENKTVGSTIVVLCNAEHPYLDSRNPALDPWLRNKNVCHAYKRV